MMRKLDRIVGEIGVVVSTSEQDGCLAPERDGCPVPEGTAQPMCERSPTNKCRRCHLCQGASHHWMPDFDDGDWEHSPEPRPIWACKHCDFTMPMDGSDTEGLHVERLYAAHYIEDMVDALARGDGAS